MTIENLILNGQVHTLLYENKTMSKTPLSEMLPSIMKLFEKSFCM